MTPPGFTGAGIDRADHLRLDPVGLADMVRSQMARRLGLAGLDPVLDDEGNLVWSQLSALETEKDFIFLGLDSGTPMFAPLLDRHDFPVP